MRRLNLRTGAGKVLQLQNLYNFYYSCMFYRVLSFLAIPFISDV